VAFVGLLSVSVASSRADIALQAGEELTYSVRWAVLPGAGEIKIAAEEVNDGTPRLSITTSTQTRGLAKALLTFEAHSESTFDLQSGRLVALHESTVTRKKHVVYAVSFDHAQRRAQYRAKGAESAKTLEMPEGNPADLITTLMKTRLWDLEPGQSRDVLVSYRDEFYELTIHATGLEQVKTPLGEFDAVVLEPRMEKTPPKGMFKRGANVRVWVSRDGSRLPVRFQVEFKFGTGVATLVKYQPPLETADARFTADE
jgi:hypothetical protein